MQIPWRLIVGVAGFWVFILIEATQPLFDDVADDVEVVDAQYVAEAFDLGVATYPAGSETFAPTRHRWQLKPDSPRYGVAYAHGKQALADVKADHLKLARRWSFRWSANDRFSWRRPENCKGEAWDCVYRQVYHRSVPDLAPFLRRFQARATAERWTRGDIARWLLAFVQQIEYRLPDDYAFGLLPPALVVSLSYGDCDSKSLLLIHLLAGFGIDARLVRSDAHQHALVGIDVPSSGQSFLHRGQRYAWAETTAVDAPLGWRHPRMKVPDDWQVVRSL
jgi:transglutaminase-like putative cysteine protease